MPPSVESALDRLEDARQRWWIYSLLCNVLLVIVVSLGTLVLFIMADVWLRLSQPWLWGLLIAWTTLSVAMFFHTVYRLLRYQRTTEATARRVELSFPELGSHLINLIQLMNSSNGASEGFRQAAIAEAAGQVQGVRFQTAADRQSRWDRWRNGLQTPRDLVEFGSTLGLVIALAVGFSAAVPTWRSSADRLFTPWQFVPQTGSIQILEVTPGDAELLVGSRLEIAAKIADPGPRQPAATLFLQMEGETTESTRMMVPNDAHDAFAFTLPSLGKPLKYHLQIGDSQSDIYHLGVRDMPTVRDVEVTYEYPSYLELPSLTVYQKHADLDAPQYTTAHLKLTCSTPLARGHAQFPSRQIVGRVADDAHVLAMAIPMQEATNFTLHLFNDLGHTDAEPRVNNLHISLDSPPTVQIAKPSRETTIAPGSELPIVVRAADDHGLGTVRLEWKMADDPEASEETNKAELLHAWERIVGSTTTFTHNMHFSPERFEPGPTILVRAVALDRRSLSVGGSRLEPQAATSSWIRIKLISPEEQASETLVRIEGLNAKLWAILQTQLRARVTTAQVTKQESFDNARQLATDVRRRQIQVQTNSADLTKSIDASAGENEATAKQALAKLAHGEMLRAVQQAEQLAAAPLESEAAELVPPLIETQDRVIGMLRKLLELNRRASTDALAEVKDRQGSDLPMAELPSELEDLVGELMEEEEDLFDEMEDMSSSWVSIAKGAGWDAMDGPISNMSAKGVTATGGGKESGAGGEGLEGPVPPQAQRELDRMANKQAELRKRAESVDVKFQVMNYHHTDLQRMVETMKSVEADLRSGRYQSALRRREVILDGLGNIKTYLDGEFEVRRDETSNLPEDIQKELLGSMLDASPAGWEELNRKYFERLTYDRGTREDE